MAAAFASSVLRFESSSSFISSSSASLDEEDEDGDDLVDTPAPANGDGGWVE